MNTQVRLLIVAAAAIGLLGCRRTPPANPQAAQKAAMAASRASPGAAVVSKFLAGTWRWRPNPDSEESITIQLSTDGRWRWDPSPPSSAALPESQGGIWFVHQGILVLRVQGDNTGQTPPGVAFTFDLKSVTAQQAVMSVPGESQDVVWERLAEPGGPATGSQPLR